MARPLKIKSVHLATYLTIAGTAFLYCLSLVAYKHAEKRFFFWDNYAYYNYSATLLESFHLGARSAWSNFVYSLSTDYNLFFAVPIAALMGFFGEDRTTHLIINYILYGFSFQLCVCLFFSWAVKRSDLTTIVVAFVLPMFFPMLTVVYVIGLPDIGGAVLVLLAIWSYLAICPAKPKLGSLVAGIFLGLAFVFRRHYAYSDIAFLVTVGIFESVSHLLPVPQKEVLSFSWLRQTIWQIIKIPLIAGMTLFFVCLILIPRYTIHSIFFNPSTAYASYLSPIDVVANAYIQMQGAGLIVFAMIGYIVFLYFNEHRRNLLFVFVISLLWFALWCLHVRFISPDYWTQIFPLFITFGIGALILEIRTKLNSIGMACAAVILVIIIGINYTVGLWIDRVPTYTLFPVLQKVDFIFATPILPIIDANYDEQKRLIEYLRSSLPQDNTVYVAASSGNLNRDIITNGEADLYGRMNRKIHVLPASDIDGRDPAPYDVFVQGSVFIATSKPEMHRPPEYQRSISAVNDLFTSSDPALSSFQSQFTRDQEIFRLTDGVEIYVWRRSLPWDILKLASGLHHLHASLEGSALPAQDWVALEHYGPFSAKTSGESRRPTEASLHLGGGPLKEKTRLLFIGNSSDANSLSGHVDFLDERCRGVKLHLQREDSQQGLIEAQEVMLKPGEEGKFHIALPPKTERPSVLTLEFMAVAPDAGAANYCSLKITELGFFPQ